jgi:hypothetical protein
LETAEYALDTRRGRTHSLDGSLEACGEPAARRTYAVLIVALLNPGEDEIVQTWAAYGALGANPQCGAARWNAVVGEGDDRQTRMLLLGLNVAGRVVDWLMVFTVWPKAWRG